MTSIAIDIVGILSNLGVFAALFYAGMALATLSAWKLLQAYITFLTSPLRQVPGPPWKNFLLGHMRVIQKEAFMTPQMRWWEKARHESRQQGVPLLAYTSLFGRATVCVLDPELVQTIMMDQYSREPLRFTKQYELLRVNLGNGLVTLEGPAWARHRRIIQPSFVATYVKEALNACVPRRTATLIRLWKQAGPNRVIDLGTHMSALTLDVIGDVAFSHDFQGLESVRKWAEQQSSSKLAALEDPVIQAFQKVFSVSSLNILLAVTKQIWIYRCLPKVVRLQRALNEAVDDIINEARSKDRPDLGPGKKSLLQLLFHAQDQEHHPSLAGTNKTLNAAELRDECKTFIMAGHETTSTWCYWALYALGLHPTVQEKVHAEVHDVVGDAGKIDLPATEKMPYLWAFLQEVLRFYPPVGFVVRNTERTEQWKGYTIPVHTRLSILMLMLHRNPEYWNDDPGVFQPDRWLQSDANPPMKHKFCFLPFAAGPRNCVGQRFAQIEVTMIVATIVRELVIQLAPGMANTKIDFTCFVTLKSKAPLEITVRSRK